MSDEKMLLRREFLKLLAAVPVAGLVPDLLPAPVVGDFCHSGWTNLDATTDLARYAVIQMSPMDDAFLEWRQCHISSIARVFNIPAELLADLA